jgi:hypothetical protein
MDARTCADRRQVRLVALLAALGLVLAAAAAGLQQAGQP